MAGKPRRKSLSLAEAATAPPHFHGHRQRLRERLIAAGAENLPDYELMEVLLFAGNPRGDVKPLAKNLIDRFGGFAATLSADADALLQVPGLGVSGVAALKSVREAALRLMKAELSERPVIGSWDQLIDYCRAHIAYGKVEEFHLLFLDRKNALIEHEQQQRGTVDHTPVYTREVVKRALELGASSLILVHNHPTRPVSITFDHAPTHWKFRPQTMQQATLITPPIPSRFAAEFVAHLRDALTQPPGADYGGAEPAAMMAVI